MVQGFAQLQSRRPLIQWRDDGPVPQAQHTTHYCVTHTHSHQLAPASACHPPSIREEGAPTDPPAACKSVLDRGQRGLGTSDRPHLGSQSDDVHMQPPGNLSCSMFLRDELAQLPNRPICSKLAFLGEGDLWDPWDPVGPRETLFLSCSLPQIAASWPRGVLSECGEPYCHCSCPPADAQPSAKPVRAPSVRPFGAPTAGD